MKYVISVIFMLVIIEVTAAEFNVLPEIVKVVPLSSTDVNRVSCNNGIISDVIYSKEKGVVVNQVGKNAFIKFMVQVKGNKQIYITKSTEFHIVCDGEIYTIIAKPATGNPVIIRLGDNLKKSMKHNIIKSKSISKEKQILDLTRDILSQKYDSNHMVVEENEEIELFNEIELRKMLTVKISGVGIEGAEYLAVAKIDIQNMNERDFLNEKLGAHIIGITVHPKRVKKGEKSRIIIVSEANR